MSVLSLTDKVKVPEIQKSEFDLSFINSTTGEFGVYYPIYCEEVVPGDYFRIDVSHIIRCFPYAGALNHRVDLFVHAFFVPNRIIWEDWEAFIMGEGGTTFPVSNLKNQTIAVNSIGTYLGMPQVGFGGTYNNYVSDLPKRAYIQIWNDFYRNKIIQDKLDYAVKGYPDQCIIANWRKDYFTSALPSPQLGNASTLNMDIVYSGDAYINPTTVAEEYLKVQAGTGKVITSSTGATPSIENLTSVGIDVNDVRYAYAYQDYLYRLLVSGDDYRDHLKNIFGVISEDSRMQKAEYLGGYTSPIIVNEITSQVATYDSGDTLIDPMGTQQSVGSSFGKSDSEIQCNVKEHGYIMIIAHIKPKTSYYGGMPRHFFKQVPLDFYFPQFAYLPEQEMYEGELYYVDNTTNEDTFGYIERYAEYKHRNDMVTANMVKDFDHLHFARMFQSVPTLNDAFLKMGDLRQDAFAVQHEDHWYGQFGFTVKAMRPMPFNVNGIGL